MTEAFYSFDTSAFINGRRDLLPPEVFTMLGTNIEQMIADGFIRSVDVVRDEIGRRDDATRAWTVAQEGLFVVLDEEVQAATSATLAVHSKLMGRGGRPQRRRPIRHWISSRTWWNRGNRGDAQ